MGKKLIIVSGMILVILCAYIYVDQRYFYNPVAFTQDDITPYHWSDYERPVTLTYYDLKKQREAHNVEQEKVVRSFLTEMKNSPEIQNDGMVAEVRGAMKLSCEGKILLEVYFYEDYWKVLRDTETVYRMTHELKEIIDTL